jgi:3-deoxy-D-manno-octulosonate 8-phosphate phosphatase (KDO 8-P phosphatase)
MHDHSHLINKAKNIKLAIFDVDGVFTSGLIYYGNQGQEMRGFHIHDGMGIKMLQKMDITVAIISAKQSDSVQRRINDLQIKYSYLGYEDKLLAFADIKKKLQVSNEQIAYMGDDLPDLPILSQVALAITVPEAPDFIKENVHLITTHSGGQGAVREACEFIMQAQDHERYQAMLQSYISSPA